MSEEIDYSVKDTYTSENLFKRLVELKAQQEVVREDIKMVKEDFTASQDNPRGLDKDHVKAIDKAATFYVKNNFDKVKDEFESALYFYEALTEE